MKKYNKEYYENIKHWSHVANSDIEYLKECLHGPYKINGKFESIETSLIDVEDVSGIKTLLFGCGIGRNLQFAKSISDVVHGYDIPDMIERCKKENNNFDLLTSDWNEILKNKYDLILDIFTIQFIPDLDAIKDFLNDMANITNYYYLSIRNFLSDNNHTHVIDFFEKLNIFELVSYTFDISDFSTIKFPNESYADLLFKSKKAEHNNKISLCFQAVGKNNTWIPNEINQFPCGISKFNDISKYNKQLDFAYFVEDAEYYDFTIFSALGEIGYDIDVFTKKDPRFIDDFYYYKIPNINIVDLDKIDLPKCEAYFGSDLCGIEKALKHGYMYNKPVYLILKNTPQFLSSKKLNIDNHKKIRTLLHRHKNRIPSLTCFTYNDSDQSQWSNFLKMPIDHFQTFRPLVNNRCNNFNQEKENFILTVNDNFCSNLLETFKYFLTLLHDNNSLHIITNNFNGIYENCTILGMDYKTLFFHKDLSDSEKFSLIKRAKLLFTTSLFQYNEQHIIEALSCKTPVVCYNLDCIKDLEHPYLYKAEVGDNKQFEQNLIEAKDLVIRIAEDKFNIDSNLLKIKKRFNIHYKKNIYEFEEKKETNFSDFKTVYNTKPLILHFNSIYRTIIKTKNNHHSKDNCKIFNSVINKYANDNIKLNNCSDIKVFTFSNCPRQTILESFCDMVGIELEVLGKDILNWNHNNRIQYVLDYIETVKEPYLLHVDAFDAIIVDNIDILLNYKNKDTKVLFNAEEICHPASEEIAEKQRNLLNHNTNFQYLNAGVFFGKKENIKTAFQMVQKYKKYKSTSLFCDGCDQGKINQLYIDRPDLIEIDSKCKFFYSNDYETDAKQYLKLE